MLSSAVDHLVVAARTLDEGVAWCEATLGVTPDAGGRHALMGTHNRLLSIASSVFERAYLELIAIDPHAPSPRRPRWFDLEQPAMQAALAGGPQLIHWVMQRDDLDACMARWREAGINPGEAIAAQRDTPEGVLRWRIGVRADGARPGGAVPTLIEWGDRHPSQRLPARGVALRCLTLAGLPEAVRRDCASAGLRFADAGPALVAELETPRGQVSLSSMRMGEPDVQP